MERRVSSYPASVHGAGDSRAGRGASGGPGSGRRGALVQPQPRGGASARPLPRRDARPAPPPASAAPALGSRNRPGARLAPGRGCPTSPTRPCHTLLFFTSPCAPLWRGYWRDPHAGSRFLSCRCPRASTPAQTKALLSSACIPLVGSLLRRVHLQIAQTVRICFSTVE